MSTSQPSLTIKQCMRVFDVSHMSIFNWTAGTANKTNFPATGKRTPDALRKWAGRNEVRIVCDPDKALRPPAKKSTPAKVAVRKLANGRLTSARAART